MFYLSAQEDVRAFWNAGRASRFFAPPPQRPCTASSAGNPPRQEKFGRRDEIEFYWHECGVFPSWWRWSASPPERKLSPLAAAWRLSGREQAS